MGAISTLHSKKFNLFTSLMSSVIFYLFQGNFSQTLYGLNICKGCKLHQLSLLLYLFCFFKAKLNLLNEAVLRKRKFTELPPDFLFDITFTLWVVLVLFIVLSYVDVHIYINLAEVSGHKWAYLIP